MSATSESAVRVGLVYPELLGTYGDRGNAVVLVQRLRWRGHSAELVEVTAGAPIGRIVAPFDEARDGQFVDQSPERDRREVERLGEFVLPGSLAALQAREHRPLRAGGAEFAGALVGISPEQASDVVERESQLAGGGNGPFVSKR